MKTFIIGYYGSENIGDEVLLHQVIRMIREVDPEATIKSLSYRTSRTLELHGIESVSRNKYLEIARCIRQSDIIIGGGGSMLQNVTSNRSLIYYLALIQLANFHKKKVVLLGNGFGPINGRFFCRLTRKILSRIDCFAARDQDTKIKLEAIGVKTRIELAADLAYYGYQSKVRDKAKKVVINLRPWHDVPELIDEMAKVVRYLIDRGYDISFLSMQNGRDDQMQRELEVKLEMKFESELNTIDRFINNEQPIFCMIGMRLHALIWAGINDIPMIGISYAPKIEAYLDQTGQINGGQVENLKAEDLIASFEKLEANYEAYQDTLIRNNNAIAERAAKNRELLEYLKGRIDSHDEI